MKSNGINSLWIAAVAAGWSDAPGRGIRRDLMAIYPHQLPWAPKCPAPSYAPGGRWVCACGREFVYSRSPGSGRNVSEHLRKQAARRSRKSRKTSAKRFRRTTETL